MVKKDHNNRYFDESNMLVVAFNHDELAERSRIIEQKIVEHISKINKDNWKIDEKD